MNSPPRAATKSGLCQPAGRTTVTRQSKLAAALVVAALFASAPAKAQFAMDESQMQQFAPMLEMMKKQMGKQKFGELMKTIQREYKWDVLDMPISRRYGPV